jgi:hypothetical protein
MRLDDPMENRTDDLPACSTVSQLTVLPRIPRGNKVGLHNIHLNHLLTLHCNRTSLPLYVQTAETHMTACYF